MNIRQDDRYVLSIARPKPRPRMLLNPISGLHRLHVPELNLTVFGFSAEDAKAKADQAIVDSARRFVFETKHEGKCRRNGAAATKALYS